MGHSALLAALLPPVSYDVNAPGVEVSLAVDGAELDRVQAASAAVLGALQPWKWQQYLPDWERVYGLPGACAKGDQLLQERIAQLAVAFLERGGISHAWLKRYAALAGYEITIDEFTPFKAGHSRAGDPLTNDDWTYAFRVTTPSDAPVCSRPGSRWRARPCALGATVFWNAS
ncbi:putative phage tail protein [Desulfovibrio sp. G11]|uniref:putative phage tail protein n=1 Tax=Desulfovibrio sp. G11 TaxID=631220 RepID=UPI0018622634|nr:putative phage tail protein [Desulfovibrio sp. G11]SPD34986.1 Bacteriophage Mu-like, Gp48, putative phage tail protein [Desulfovibrio sp. G11]